jgi:arsenate reductase
MKAVGIDISGNGTQSVFDLFTKGTTFDAVITVCDEASAESCPVFPGRLKRIAWSFTDPSSFTGTKEEILAKTVLVRDQIEKKVLEFISQATDLQFWI